MRVGLLDIDGKMPNLALMKLSAHYKSKGCDVELTTPVFAFASDLVYASKVFTWTRLPVLPQGSIVAGAGHNIKNTLPEYIENLCPDYALYNIDYSLGFLTRGCIRQCDFCFVYEKEGYIRPAADIEDFLRHDKAVLLDNNVLAHDWGIKQLEKIARLGIKVDFNQGIDARLIDGKIASILAQIKWLKPIRLACDSEDMKPAIEKAVRMLRKQGATPRAYFCYMVVKDDIKEAHERALFLSSLGVDPFAQPFRDMDGRVVSKEAKDFARWVNHKAIFKSVPWQKYKGRGLYG